jgi:hypothetical protein
VDNKEVAEFDLVWINGTKVFIWEIKTKLTKNHIDKFLEKTLPRFKKYALKQRYNGLKMYWVMWARTFSDEQTKDYALKKWLYIMKENHKWKTKMLKESVIWALAFA